MTKIYSYFPMLIYFLRAKEMFSLLGTCDHITIQPGLLKNAVHLCSLFCKGVDLSAFTQSKFLRFLRIVCEEVEVGCVTVW